MVIALITALAALIPAVSTAVVAIVKLIKTTKKEDAWKVIMSVADAAMAQAEKSGKAGADKKQMAIDITKAACASQGIDVGDTVEQLAAYIDQSIAFAKSLKKN